jgi:hypothetical protein
MPGRRGRRTGPRSSSGKPGCRVERFTVYTRFTLYGATRSSLGICSPITFAWPPPLANHGGRDTTLHQRPVNPFLQNSGHFPFDLTFHVAPPGAHSRNIPGLSRLLHLPPHQTSADPPCPSQSQSTVSTTSDCLVNNSHYPFTHSWVPDLQRRLHSP